MFSSLLTIVQPLMDNSQRQQVLDGLLVPKTPQYMKAGLLEYIIELIVCEDEVCIMQVTMSMYLTVAIF